MYPVIFLCFSCNSMPHCSSSALHGVNTTLTDGLIERSSPMLDEIESKTMHKYKEGDQQRKKKKGRVK